MVRCELVKVENSRSWGTNRESSVAKGPGKREGIDRVSVDEVLGRPGAEAFQIGTPMRRELQ